MYLMVIQCVINAIIKFSLCMEVLYPKRAFFMLENLVRRRIKEGTKKKGSKVKEKMLVKAS